jgi:molybdopterin converting factor small subunit
MVVTVFVPIPLRESCGGTAELAVAAPTVRGALEEIAGRHPALYRSLCDETGALRRHIGLFVNKDHVPEREGLDTALVPGDRVTILPAVSGG